MPLVEDYVTFDDQYNNLNSANPNLLRDCARIDRDFGCVPDDPTAAVANSAALNTYFARLGIDHHLSLYTPGKSFYFGPAIELPNIGGIAILGNGIIEARGENEYDASSWNGPQAGGPASRWIKHLTYKDTDLVQSRAYGARVSGMTFQGGYGTNRNDAIADSANFCQCGWRQLDSLDASQAMGGGKSWFDQNAFVAFRTGLQFGTTTGSNHCENFRAGSLLLSHCVVGIKTLGTQAVNHAIQSLHFIGKPNNAPQQTVIEARQGGNFHIGQVEVAVNATDLLRTYNNNEDGCSFHFGHVIIDGAWDSGQIFVCDSGHAFSVASVKIDHLICEINAVARQLATLRARSKLVIGSADNLWDRCIETHESVDPPNTFMPFISIDNAQFRLNESPAAMIIAGPTSDGLATVDYRRCTTAYGVPIDDARQTWDDGAVTVTKTYDFTTT